MTVSGSFLSHQGEHTKIRIPMVTIIPPVPLPSYWGELPFEAFPCLLVMRMDKDLCNYQWFIGNYQWFIPQTTDHRYL